MIEVGNTIGNYRILQEVGLGGMGKVYRGIDVMLEREVAIKVLRPELTMHSSLVERFRKEAMVLAKLNHPNIALLYNLLNQGNLFSWSWSSCMAKRSNRCSGGQAFSPSVRRSGYSRRFWTLSDTLINTA